MSQLFEIEFQIESFFFEKLRFWDIFEQNNIGTNLGKEEETIK